MVYKFIHPYDAYCVVSKNGVTSRCNNVFFCKTFVFAKSLYYWLKNLYQTDFLSHPNIYYINKRHWKEKEKEQQYCGTDILDLKSKHTYARSEVKGL